jgi:ring-1,2-phenylacetyl-CoA epoxidase subunit PaaE
MDNVNRRVKRGWMNLKVDKIILETPDTKTFVLVDADEGGRPWDYWAGQYLTFRFDGVAEKPIVRSYTMSSSTNQGEICAFTVKRVEKGLISNWLCDNIKVGDILRARGPIGRFIYEPEKDCKHLVMVAAGSGVTPFVSIMREYAGKLGTAGAPTRMTLVVSFRSRDDIILAKDLTDFAKISGCRVIVSLSRDPSAPAIYGQGRVTADLIVKSINDDFTDCTFMSCGPTAIMDLTGEVARSKKVPDAQIKNESFET